MALPSFIFGGSTNLSYDELQNRRKVANALAAQLLGSTPKNTGEGIGAVLKGLGVGISNYRNNQAETTQRGAATDLFNSIIGGSSAPTPSTQPSLSSSAASSGVARELNKSAPMQVPDNLKAGIAETASALGISPIDLATAISYETAGTFDPSKKGPRTQWGQHQGLIQFGEPQAQKYGVNWDDPIGSQLGANGAVANYLRDTGVKPGAGLMDIYSAINAGAVGRNNASDANNGGAPGTVADKVNNQMAGHRAKALALFGNEVQQPQDSQAMAPQTPSMQNGVDPRLYQALANPWLNEGQKASIQAVIQQQQQAADRQYNEQAWRSRNEFEQQQKTNSPEYKLGLEKAQLEVEALRNPAAAQTDDIREYNFAVQQGFQGNFADFMQQMRRAGATSVTVGGGENKQVFDAVAESASSARSAATGLNALREAKTAVDGGIISGFGADARLGLQKVGALLGVSDPEAIQNTETFRAAIAPQVSAVMKATVGSTQISNSDREFAERAAGGSINLDEGSIKRLLGIMEKAGRAAVQSHNERLNKVYPEGGGFDRERALFGVDEPAPMAQQPTGVPQGVSQEEWDLLTPEERRLWQ